MEDWEKIHAVNRMQEYIEAHIHEEITLQELSAAAGYSPYHALRVFKELTDQTPFAFIRAIRLTKAVEALRDPNQRIVNIALGAGFDSHDGFTRAFSKRFGLTPQRYRQETPAIFCFTYTPIAYYYEHVKNGRNCRMEKRRVPSTVTATVIERPAPKLVLLRSKQAMDYFSFCEEVGCEWHGLLDSIPEKLDPPALLTLPAHLIKEGTSATACGVEVPFDYNKPLPKGYEMLDLPPCKMLVFQGMPYEDEGDFGEALGIVFEAIENYQPERYGYRYADDVAPRFNFGSSAENGAKMAVPVMSLDDYD